MAKIFGGITADDTEAGFLTLAGRDVIYDVARQWTADENAAMENSFGVLIDGTTTDHTHKFKLPPNGLMPKRNNEGRYDAVKTSGAWTVSYPLEDFGSELSVNDVDFAKMSANEFDLHVESIGTSNRNTISFNMLRRLLNNTNFSFNDPEYSTLTIKPLANGDTDKYPALRGTGWNAADITHNHYLASGYVSASITDTNNPVTTMVKHMTHHYAYTNGGMRSVVWIHSDEQAKIEAITSFVPYPDFKIITGDNVDTPIVPSMVPGEFVGVLSGAWICVWDNIPSGYMLSTILGTPQPCKMRVDEEPVARSVGRGLTMVAQENMFPHNIWTWRHRYGIGTSNRLGAVVLQLTTGSYTIPSDYA